MELLTDDMDIRDTKLSIDFGGNGDYYLTLKETKKDTIVRLDTRIAMSGGNATTEVALAIANLYRALNNVETSEQVDNDALLARVKDIEGRELLRAFLEHIESTIDFLPCEPSELIDDYFKSL